MMGAPALPQAQTGIAAILAAMGPATPAANGKGGFEQLITALPGNAPTPVDGLSAMTAPTVDGVPDTETSAIPPATQTLAINPVLSQPGPKSMAVLDIDPAAPVASELPSKAVAKPAGNTPAAETDAAAAASLLIAVATPRAGTTTAKPTTDAAGKRGAKTDDEKPAVAAADAAVATAVIADPAQPTAPVAVAIAASIVAADGPATEAQAEAGDAAQHSATATILADTARPAVKPAKAELAAPVRDNAAAAPQAAKPDPATAPISVGKPAAEGLRASVDTGASMAVLFGQPSTNGAAATADIARAAPVTERLLDMGSDDQWIAQLAADIAATKSESGDLSFRLMPRNLGRLDVAMKMEEGGAISMKLDTQHEATATIVQAAQPRLVEDLRQQGVRVTDAQVTHTPAETGRQQQQPQGQGRQAAPGASHLIETAPERSGADEDRAADRRGRFA